MVFDDGMNVWISIGGPNVIYCRWMKQGFLQTLFVPASSGCDLPDASTLFYYGNISLALPQSLGEYFSGKTLDTLARLR